MEYNHEIRITKPIHNKLQLITQNTLNIQENISYTYLFKNSQLLKFLGKR